MLQETLDEAVKTKTLVKQSDLEWNLAHGMFYLSLCQVHMSGAIGNLLQSKKPEDQKAARKIYKAISCIDAIYKPGAEQVNYDKYLEQLTKIMNIISMLIDRSDHLGQIAGFLQNDKNFKPKNTPTGTVGKKGS